MSGLPIAGLMPSRSRRPGPVFLRFGTWNPEFPRSQNNATGAIEHGLSVYALDAAGRPVVPEVGEWAAVDLAERVRGDDPKFLVQGCQIDGLGHDGEPVLIEVVVVGLWRDPNKATVDLVAEAAADLAAWGHPSESPKKWRLKTEDWQAGKRGEQTFVGEVAGCSVFVESHPNGYGTYLTAATASHEQVADLFYCTSASEGIPENYLTGDQMEGAVEVRPDMRRKGIASFLYAKAEELTGKTFRPSLPHSPDAEAFWNQSERSFGNVVEPAQRRGRGR